VERHNWKAIVNGKSAHNASRIASLSAPLPAQRIANSLRSLHGALKEADTDLDQLATMIESNWPAHGPAPVIPIKSSEPKRDWQIVADRILRDHADNTDMVWGSRERNFLQFMSQSTYAPSRKREKWLLDISARIPSQQEASS
jgi:hypothetical protein